MKMLASFFISALSFTALPAFASDSVCEAYAKADDNALLFLKSVDPATATLSKTEEALILSTMMAYEPGHALTAGEAIQAFLDVENDGSSAGTLSYSELTFGTRKVTIIRVTFYPGDNEYGSLFTYKKESDGNEYVELIGQVADGDSLCLSYVE